jgi:trans-2,3-dihydro-3-hydroxyanthranilate isomerase
MVATQRLSNDGEMPDTVQMKAAPKSRTLERHSARSTRREAVYEDDAEQALKEIVAAQAKFADKADKPQDSSAGSRETPRKLRSPQRTSADGARIDRKNTDRERRMLMRYKFTIVDVFSATPFGGNQLAVLPQAAGITAEGMQAIAGEFNFSETTFVLPATDANHSCRVRIFTPKAELPFAGHPTIGTACVLVHGHHLASTNEQDLIFAEDVGPVEVNVKQAGDGLRAKLTLNAKPERREFSGGNPALASVLSLPAGDVLSAFFASVGVPLCFARLRDRHAVDRATLDRAAWSKVLADAWSSMIFLFAGDLTSGSELYARMFAPAYGVEEDPATGAGCAALVGALAAGDTLVSDTFSLSIIQGVAMGRPSQIRATARKANGEVVSVSVEGATAFIAEGEIEVPAHFLAG